MPKINSRETKKVALPSIEGGEVEIYTSLTAGDVQDINDSGAKSILTPLRLMIKSWNLQDAKGVDLQINEANIKLLDIRDVNKITDEMGVNITTLTSKQTPAKKNG